jgi:glycine betaine/proline transport system permease protein
MNLRRVFDELGIPRMPLDEWIDSFFEYIQVEFREFFRWIAGILRALIGSIEDFLLGDWGFLAETAFFQTHDWILPLVVFFLFIALAWAAAGWRLALFSLLGLGLIVNLGLWEQGIRTLSIVIAAGLICSLIGIPTGILMARNDSVEAAIRPVLDFMQTMPAFVYLIPAVALFGLREVPATVATVIFAMPPIVRLTNHGIRTVDKEIVEASEAFGSNPWQTLLKVQLPLARPSIMLGLNQTLMLSLSMAVIAAMIGAAGLGGIVLRSLTGLDIGVGFVGGLGIVILAVYLDRVTQGLGRMKEPGEAGFFKGFGQSMRRTFAYIAGGPWGREQAQKDEEQVTSRSQASER